MANNQEQYNNLAASTTTGTVNNSSNPVTFSVQSGDGALFPATTNGPFRVTLSDADGSNAEVMMCTSRTTDSFTCSRGSSATNEVPIPTLLTHGSGSIVSHDITTGAYLSARSEQCQNDTIANMPTVGRVGDLYIASDSIYDFYRWNGSSWDPFVAGIKCVASTTSTFGTQKKSTNATVDTYATRNGGLVLTGHVSGGDNFIGELQAYPSAPFTRIFRFNAAFFNSSLAAFGMAIYQTTGDKAISYGFSQRSSQGFVSYSWNTVASGSASFYVSNNTAYFVGRGGLMHIKYNDDQGGTNNRRIYISADGLNWILIQSISNTDFITPTHIGIFMLPYGNVTDGSVLTLYDYQ